MANYAKIVFAVPNPLNASIGLGEVLIFRFDGQFIYATSSISNNYSLDVRSFAVNIYDTDFVSTWGLSLKNCIEEIYCSTLGFNFNISLIGNTIEFYCTEYGHFFEVYRVESEIDTFNPAGGTVTLESQDLLSVTSKTQIQAPQNRENKVIHKFELVNYNSPVHINNPSNQISDITFVAPFLFFEGFRGMPPSFINIEDSLGYELLNISVPYISTWEVVSVQVFGGNAVINAGLVGNLYDVVTTLTYSIDGNSFQNSNSFTDLIAGDYTAYILDSLGGVWSKDFTVYESTNRPLPFCDISDVNSIQFRDSAQSGNYKSLFSKQKFINQERVCFNQIFKNDFTAITQVRTSYQNIVATCDNLTFNCTKVIENIGQIDWRDCKFADGGIGKTLIYFQSGNVYDPTTGDIIRTYNNVTVAGLTIDEWQKEGIVVAFTFGEFEVVDSIFSTTVGGMCLIVNTNFLNFEPEICKSTYNAEDWDVWEFATDMGLLDQTISHQITIEFTDSEFPTKTWPSEPFKVTSDTENELLKIEAWGDSAISDMLPTEIVHTVFLEAVLLDSEPFQDLETTNNDRSNSIKIKSCYDQGFTLSTNAISAYLMHKINLMCMFDNILIDGLSYSVDKEAKIEFWNEKQNPLVVLKRSFRANKTATNIETTTVTSRVLGVSNITVLGA